MIQSNLKEATSNVNSLSSETGTTDLGKQNTKPLSALNRQLTEDDLGSAGVRKMLLGQMDEFDSCKNELAKVSIKYHERDKEAEVLSAKLKAYISFDWMYSILLTVGSILIGYYASQPNSGIILLLIGIVCILISIIFKCMLNHENKVQ